MSKRAFKKVFGLGPWLKGQTLVWAIESKGADLFNSVRSNNPFWIPDFSGADLNRMDLSGANINSANFVGAQVDGIIIDGLELRGERALNTLRRRGAIVE